MTQTDSTEALAALRAQRADLWRHLVALEDALAKPVPGRAGAWAADAHDVLVDLNAAFERHIALTEGSGGLFASVIDSAPRLEGAVERLREEHDEISGALAAELRELRGLDGPAAEPTVVDARQRLTTLLSQLSLHRQAGADLVYEAYAVDIGVGD